MGKFLKVLHAADLHLGHLNVPAEYIADNIIKYLFPELENADIVFLTGDIFDASVSMNSDSAKDIISLFIDLFREAYEKDVKVRILQGTFSHDRHQLDTINKLFSKLMLKVDFKYVKNVYVENIKTIGDILYLPDNLPFINNDSLFSHIRSLMTANGIKQFDFIICHGEFEHICNRFGHSHRAYLVEDFFKILKPKGKILSGHIHTASKYSSKGFTFAYSGSFDRLAQNEESPKGFWVIEDDVFRFVENKDASVFITHNVMSDTLPEIIEEIEKLIEKRFSKNKEGFLRLVMADRHLRQPIEKYFNQSHPIVKISFKKKTSSDKIFEFVDQKLHGHIVKEELEVPSQKNIARIIYDFIKKKEERTVLTIADIEEVLDDKY